MKKTVFMLLFLWFLSPFAWAKQEIFVFGDSGSDQHFYCLLLSPHQWNWVDVIMNQDLLPLLGLRLPESLDNKFKIAENFASAGAGTGTDEEKLYHEDWFKYQLQPRYEKCNEAILAMKNGNWPSPKRQYPDDWNNLIGQVEDYEKNDCRKLSDDDDVLSKRIYVIWIGGNDLLVTTKIVNMPDDKKRLKNLKKLHQGYIKGIQNYSIENIRTAIEKLVVGSCKAKNIFVVGMYHAGTTPLAMSQNKFWEAGRASCFFNSMLIQKTKQWESYYKKKYEVSSITYVDIFHYLGYCSSLYPSVNLYADPVHPSGSVQTVIAYRILRCMDSILDENASEETKEEHCSGIPANNNSCFF